MFKIDVNDRISRKRVQDLLIPLIHICVVVGYKPTKPLVGVLANYLRFLGRFCKNSGVAGCCLYLKRCFIILQQSVSGYKPDLTLKGPRVRLAGAFLPSIIPIQHRCRIRRNDAKVIQLWLSLFSLYRVLEYPGELKLNTIIDPCVNEALMEKQVEQLEGFIEDFYDLLSLPRNVGRVPKRGITVYPTESLEEETFPVAKPYIISKSSPQTDQTQPDFMTASSQGSLRSAAQALWESSV